MKLRFAVGVLQFLDLTVEGNRWMAPVCSFRGWTHCFV